VADFPVFNADLARTEMGRVGGKAVHTDRGAISLSTRRLYAAISSKPFLELVSRLSGNPGLILDPKCTAEARTKTSMVRSCIRMWILITTRLNNSTAA
jgi:hypothetical protein